MSAVPIVIVGGGGHAAVIIDAVRAGGLFEPRAVVDERAEAAEVLGVPVIGGDEQLGRLRREGLAAAVIAIGSNALRQKLGEMVLAEGFALPAIVHPSAQLSPSATVGVGVVVMARACIGARATVDDLAIINTAAIIEHDNHIGVAAHVAPGVALAGCVRVGDRALVGVGSAARPGVSIGDDAIVGAGSAIVSDIPAGALVGGCPARGLRSSGNRA
jgi:UDP-perosamine 4-acetyltransferase